MCALGLLPHVRFSLLVGQLAWFESAYDEATYALWAFTDGGPRLPSRWLSAGALKLLLDLTRSWDLTLIAADAVFPALCAVLAWFLMGRVTQLRLIRLVLALGLLFAQEFFSFGCWTIWRVSELVDATPSSPATVYDLRSLREASPAWLVMLVPDYSSPFLSLFRTPEPQISMAVLIAALILAIDLSRHRNGDAVPLSRRTLVAAVLHALLGLVYFFEATVIVLLEGFLAALLLARGSARPAKLVAALAALGGLSIALGALVSQSDSAARSWAFRSHLPVVTPATLAACAGLVTCVALLRRTKQRGPALLPLATACFGAVLTVTNQQLLTGWMISTRDWERYADYPVVFFGIVLIGHATLRLTAVHARFLFAAAGAALASGAHGVVVAQDRVFAEEFLAANLKSVAMAQAVRAAEASGHAGTLLVLEEPVLSPLLQTRLAGRVQVLADAAQINLRQIDPLDMTNGASGRSSRHRRELFEYFARFGRTPGGVGRLLRSEADGGAGFALSLLFDLRDWWDPITDGRALRRDRIRSLLPGIVQDYEQYLRGFDPCWTRPVLILTRQLPSDRKSELWAESFVAESTVGSLEPMMNAHVILQSSASNPGAERGGGMLLHCEP